MVVSRMHTRTRTLHTVTQWDVRERVTQPEPRDPVKLQTSFYLSFK